jgi:hypothetical protein
VIGACKKAFTPTAKPRPHTTTSARHSTPSGALPSNVMTASTVLSKALTTPRHIPLMQIPDQAPASPISNGAGKWMLVSVCAEAKVVVVVVALCGVR